MAAAVMSSWLYEKRPLKRPKLGPPDVYPQDPKQREDELTAVNVKQGFLTSTVITDEYGSAKNQASNINANKFGSSFSALLSKKQEINTLQDNAKKKQQINTKDNIWLVTARSKNTVDAWFKDLSSGSKTLSQLNRRIPIFNKKEEIFLQLNEFQVPMVKASWFIKMSCAYQIALSEANNKSKKRQIPDQSQEWTNALCRFLREQYQKLSEFYHGVSPLTSSVQSTMTSDSLQKNWQYFTQLTRHLFEEGLLDKHDFLTWLLDLFEKIKSPDDSVMKIIIPLLLQYVDDFTESEILSRKLAFQCTKKLNLLINDFTNFQNNPNENNKTSVSSPEDNENTKLNNMNNENSSASDPLISCFSQLLNCTLHRSVVLGLSSIIQIITLNCPTALVWHNINEGKTLSSLHGSPLDNLPCSPSCLPMPQKDQVQFLRNELRQAEEQIRQRSKLSEIYWSCDRWQKSSGNTVTKLLDVLDYLDRHCFDKIDSNNFLDALYGKIFSTFNGNTVLSNNNSGSNSNNNDLLSKNINEIVAQDEPIVKLLCEWAVTTKRTGEHRALVVAKLLEKRQNELTADKEIEIPEQLDNESTTNNVNGNKPSDVFVPIYQNLLLSFLDNQAPVYQDKKGNSNPEAKQAFLNLILLFGELIRCDVFSHDLYMCALIQRGQFSNSPHNSLLSNVNSTSKTNSSEESLPGFVSNLPPPNELLPNNLGGIDSNSVQRSTSSSSLPMFDPVSNHQAGNHQDQLRWDVPSMDIDEANLDEDLDKLLQHIKAGQQNMNDQTDILLPDSVGSDREDETRNVLTSQNSGFATSDNNSIKSTTARHLLYTMHFPLPQDDTSIHDCNQRHILLYGVGKARDEARHLVKKVTKEISKLFNRKSSMDINDGAKVKKHAIKEGFNFDSAITKFQSLSTFDQHVVITSCSNMAIEMLNGVAIGTANYLPLIESVAFLFDLMEMALYVHGLIEFVIQMLKELVEVDIQLHQKCPILARTYCTSIGLYIIGILYRYHTCLLVSHEETVAVFEGLRKLVRHVSNPSDCTSAERCILFYLYDLYYSHNYLKLKYQDVMSSLVTKIKSMNSNPSIPQPGPTLRWNNNLMMEYLKNPKIKVDPLHIRQLSESNVDRYSFVCNAIHSVSTANDIDRLNEISVLCAELTASCQSLSLEWLCVLKALCCSSNHSCGYFDLLSQVDVGDLSIHDNLAVFTSILIARRCFSLKDFIINVAVPSLLAPCQPEGAEDAEPGARLTCHLLLCLFKTSESPLSSTTMATFASTSRYSLTSPGPSILAATPPNPGQRPLYIIKYPCDRYLLAAAHSTLRVEIVLTVLKAILVLGNHTEKRGNDGKAKSENKELSISDILGPIGGDDDFDLGIVPFANKSGTPRVDSIHEKVGLSESAKYALRQICGQQWVHDRCLRGFMIDTEMLSKLLLDPKLSHKEAQHLLNMICYPKQIGINLLQDMEMDQKSTIAKILQRLDEWTIRVSWLQLQLMFAQCSSQSSNDVSNWLDNVAKATVDFFQNASEESSKNVQIASQTTIFGSKDFKNQNTKINHGNDCNQSLYKDRIWLIAPLISKLNNSVQGKILKVAANVLEAGNWMAVATNQTSQNSYSSSKSKDRGFQQQKNIANSTSNSLLSHQPFLSLVLMCLKGQDEQRESLLSSLYNQLSQALNEKISEDLRAKQLIQEGLQLRLSLVGGMFDMIQRSSSLINDWAVLLLQLIIFSVVDPEINYQLFTTVLDMLAVLIHTTQVSDSSEPREETKKQYQNLIKKLKKELTTDKREFSSEGIQLVRQLLPIVKQQCEVITCEPMGSLIDTKGNKIQGFDSIDKKQGLQVAEKQKVSPWDLLEGHKNPSPLSWTWFGAVRIERKPLRVEENHYLLSRHNHLALKKPLNNVEPPPLPPEDADLIPPQSNLPSIINNINNDRIPMIHTQSSLSNLGSQQINLDDPLRRDVSLESSPRAATPKKVKAPRRKRQTKNTISIVNTQLPPLRAPGSYDNYSGMAPNQQPQTWYNQQGGHPNATVQQNYYTPQPQQPQQQQMIRFGERSAGSVTKGALRAMLGARQPQGGQYNIQQNQNSTTNINPNQSMQGPQSVYQARQQMMMQRQMRAQQPQQMMGPQGAMYQMQNSNQVPPAMQHHMGVQQQNNYVSNTNMQYGNSMHMQTMDQSMGQQNQAQGLPPYHNTSQNQMVQMRAQLQQSQMSQGPNSQYMVQRQQFGGMQAAPNVTMGQMGHGPMDNRQTYNQHQSMPMQSMQTGPGTHMGAQWQQTGPRGGSQQNPNLMSQLQRQLSGNSNQQMNQYNQGHY